MATSLDSFKNGVIYGTTVVVLEQAGPPVINYIKAEIKSPDPFGLVTGGRTARIWRWVVTYIRDELHSGDPFGLYTGGRTVRVIKSIFGSSSPKPETPSQPVIPPQRTS